ncbi:MAG: hypothetical protein JW885_00015 [Deltaproteobacteria bacterium]|nr:hypothetical protein [Candidatus Zymogenaceae bacterium]
MRKGTCLIVFFFVVAVCAISASGEMAARNVRIVNTSALDTFDFQKYLTDDDLNRLADLDVSENPEIFPTIESFEVEQDTYLLEFHGSIDPETEKLEFISMPYYDTAGKYDVVVVKPDGTVVRYDKEVVIDYKERTIKTFCPLTVDEGDVVLLFVKDHIETAFGGKEETSPEKPPVDSGDPGVTGASGVGRGGTGGPGPTGRP